MQDRISPIVVNKQVWDLGCGDMEYAIMLATMASHVIAVDKSRWAQPPLGVTFRQSYFLEISLDAPAEVAFLSWPINHPLAGLIGLLMQFETVIYLGQNDSFTSCGWPGLFQYFLTRELIGHHANSKNTLAIYGRPLSFCRDPLPEEAAGLSMNRI